MTPGRYFYAAWPDAAAGRALAQLAEALAPLAGGKPVPAAKIHLTLAFLGTLDAGATAAAAALRVAGEPFDLVLDRVGAFRGARVAWVGCSRPPEPLLRLQSALAARLRGAGFVLEERPFAPHVTLARGISRPVPRTATAPIAWRVREVALVRSDTGTGGYSVVERWGLGPGPEPLLRRPG